MKTKEILYEWRSFLKETNENKNYSIGLVPMSAKPFHEGHMSLVRKAAEECQEVIVYVSTSDRKRKGELSILGEDMKNIWVNILEKHLPDNTSCQYGGSPVRNVYVKLEEGLQENNLDKTYAIYTGTEDANRYNSKYYADMIDRVYIESLSRGEDTMPISGTLMRQYLSNKDKESFMLGLPKELSLEEKSEIYNILSF